MRRQKPNHNSPLTPGTAAKVCTLPNPSRHYPRAYSHGASATLDPPLRKRRQVLRGYKGCTEPATVSEAREPKRKAPRGCKIRELAASATLRTICRLILRAATGIGRHQQEPHRRPTGCPDTPRELRDVGRKVQDVHSGKAEDRVRHV